MTHLLLFLIFALSAFSKFAAAFTFDLPKSHVHHHQNGEILLPRISNGINPNAGATRSTIINRNRNRNRNRPTLTSSMHPRVVAIDGYTCGSSIATPTTTICSSTRLSMRHNDNDEGGSNLSEKGGINSQDATQSKTSVTTNIAKCICGAGSFALPHVFLEEGVLGGILAITTCGVLATSTMKSLARSKIIASQPIVDAKGQARSVSISSYVELAEVALNKNVANLVFVLTLSASIGVCSTYLVFIGQTLESLSNDAGSANIIRQCFPDVTVVKWEAVTAIVLYPLSLLRNYGIFAFTSALGVFAVVGGIFVTLLSGVYVDPGGGLQVALESIENLPMWPESLAKAFGGSFGTIAYLFCINFLTFPIINSMKDPEEYGDAVGNAVAGVWLVNVIFAVLCLGFYGHETQDLVLGNLENSPYLSALKLLLCVDLLFTFPIVFSSGRQILENALLATDDDDEQVQRQRQQQSIDDNEDSSPLTLLSIQRAGIVAVAISVCFGLGQIGAFGAVANLVGGVAQGTLAFIVPPAIAVSLSRREGAVALDSKSDLMGGEIGQLLVAIFGAAVVSSVTYFTLVELVAS
eukprot:scaffold10570_cov290-Chaetoceros_neogracile.AAC.3